VTAFAKSFDELLQVLGQKAVALRVDVADNGS
jgi:hypothetical protein